MIANIEQEYNSYVCNVWQECLEVTEDGLEQRPEYMYDNISLRSLQFLKDKLNSLEIEKS